MPAVSLKFMIAATGDWLRSIDFFRQELNILRMRLPEINAANADDTFRLQLNQFEKDFTYRLECLNHLQHRIAAQTAFLGEPDSPFDSLGHREPVNRSYDELQARFCDLEKSINMLRQKFSHFCAYWL